MSETGQMIKGFYKIFRLFNFDGGINVSAGEQDIADNECQVLENFSISEQGVLTKRKGLRRINPENLEIEIPDAVGYNNVNFETNQAETQSEDAPPAPTPPVQPSAPDGYGP